MAAIRHPRLFKAKFVYTIKLKIQFLSHKNHIWPVAAMLDSSEYWTFPLLKKVLLDGIGSTGIKKWFPARPSPGPTFRPSLGSLLCSLWIQALWPVLKHWTHEILCRASGQRPPAPGDRLWCEIRCSTLARCFWGTLVVSFSEHSSRLLKLFKFNLSPKTEGL